MATPTASRTPWNEPISSDAVASSAAADGLLLRLQRGDPSGFADAYRIHRVALHAFARRLTREAALADDIVQEVFLALPAAIALYREEASLRTFLMAIAVRRFRRHARAASRRRAALARLAREPLPAAPLPDGELGRRDLAAALRRGLEALPVAQRSAFLLCSVHGLSSDEAAVISRVPARTVRTRLFHARRRLRESLEREGVRPGLGRNQARGGQTRRRRGGAGPREPEEAVLQSSHHGS